MNVPEPHVTPAVARSRQIARDTYEVRLETAEPFAFTPGQYISVRIPNLEPPDIIGPSRDFSITAAPGSPLTICMRRGHSHYKDHLLATDAEVAVEIRGPYGFFTLPSEVPDRLVMIGGGMGVAPFMSMLRYLHANNSPLSELTLVTMDSDAARIAYRDEGAAVAAAHPRWKIVRHVGRLTAATELGNLVPDLAAASVCYIAGPPAMTNQAREIVRAFGLGPLQIRQEDFTGYMDAAD